RHRTIVAAPPARAAPSIRSGEVISTSCEWRHWIARAAENRMGAAFPGEEPSSNGKNTIGDGGNPIARNVPTNRLHPSNRVKTALAPGRDRCESRRDPPTKPQDRG